MSKNINLDEFFSEISASIDPRCDRCAKCDFISEDMKFSFSSFGAREGIGYFQSDIICNDFLRHDNKKGLDYSFLFFNVGENAVKFKTKSREMTLDKGEFWVGAMREGLSGSHEFENKAYKTQCITMKTSMAKELGILDGLNLDEDVSVKKYKINPIQKIFLSELKNADVFEGKMREIYMESKILETLYRSFGSRRDENGANFSEDEIKTLQKARRILLENMQNPPSLKELARACATNEFKLKKEFKRYFGITVYALLARERLNLAKELLASGDLSVAQAAKTVGYGSVSHFAKIFKSEFSVSPMQILKRKKYFI